MPARTIFPKPALTLATVTTLFLALIAALALSASAQARSRTTGHTTTVASPRKQIKRYHSSRHYTKPSPTPKPSSPSSGSPGSGSSGSTGSGGSTPTTPTQPTTPTTPTTPSNPTTPSTPTTPTNPTTPTTPTTPTNTGALLVAGFENNLANWNTAGVGEVIPTVTSSTVREGSKSCRVLLTGSQNRSELILGGDGSGSTRGTVEFHEGSEYWYGFSIYIQQMVYGKPGAHNAIMQFKSDGTGGPEFGLQLWDVNGKKGLWSAGDAMQTGGSGERFLAPMPEREWHDIQIHFKASEVGKGFYEVFLDGKLVDAKTGVTMIVPGRTIAYIKDGLYRNGATAPGTSEVFLDAAKLGTTRASVLPG